MTRGPLRMVIAADGKHIRGFIPATRLKFSVRNFGKSLYRSKILYRIAYGIVADGYVFQLSYNVPPLRFCKGFLRCLVA